MNNARRKAIDGLIQRAQELATATQELITEIEAIRDEEQDYFDAMPESLQGGEKGQKAEEAISQLDDAISGLEALDGDAITEALENAKA